MLQRVSLVCLALVLAGALLWLALRESGPRADGAAAESSGTSLPSFEPTDELERVAEDAPARASERHERDQSLSVLSGRVLDANSRAPLAEFGVVAKAGGAVLAETASDARGRFTFAAGEADEIALRVLAPYGWFVLDAPRTVRRNARGGFDDVVFLARPAGVAPLRLRLVDERTGESVPQYLVRIGLAEGARSPAWSNAEGVVVSEHALREGTVLLFGYDIVHPDLATTDSEPHWYREHHHAPRDGNSEVVELRIPVGPTYLLELDAPAAAPRERLLARLGSRAFRFPSLESARAAGAAVVRTGAQPWVRFPPNVYPHTDPGVLTLFSSDGRWRGEAHVSTRLGVHPGTIAVSLERCATILGRAVDPTSAALPATEVELYALDGHGGLARVAAQRAGGNGLFEFPLLAGGRYWVRGTTANARPAERELQLANGEDLEFDLVLHPRPADAAIRGRVVVAREFGAQQVGLVLLSGAAQLESQLELSSTGDAEFAFEALAAGVYELMASVYSSENDVQLIQLRSVSAPTSDVLLHFNSQEARLAIQLRARDAQSGDDIFANVHVTPQCSVVDFSLEVSASSAQPHYQFLPIDGADATWRVECRGYAPAWGPLSELNFVHGLAVLDVELTPGWGVLLEVFGPDATPLPQVEVLADSKRVATTDALGRARVALAAKPARFELRRVGWRTELASAAALTSSLDYGGALRVWMTQD
jgi:hypothetical protein